MTLLRLNILDGTSEGGAVCYDRGGGWRDRMPRVNDEMIDSKPGL
jgi:hypothetical protein